MTFTIPRRTYPLVIAWICMIYCDSTAEDCKKSVDVFPGPGFHACSYCRTESNQPFLSIKCLQAQESYCVQKDCEETALNGYSCELVPAECGGNSYLHQSTNCSDSDPDYYMPCTEYGFLYPDTLESTGGGFSCPLEDPE